MFMHIEERAKADSGMEGYNTLLSFCSFSVKCNESQQLRRSIRKKVHASEGLSRVQAWNGDMYL